MSAIRILNRKAWRAECPPVFNIAAKMARLAGNVGTLVRRDHPLAKRPVRKITAKTHRTSFHTWAIARGHRSKLFQLRIRAMRLSLGAKETGTDMHRAAGGTIGRSGLALHVRRR